MVQCLSVPSIREGELRLRKEIKKLKKAKVPRILLRILKLFFPPFRSPSLFEVDRKFSTGESTVVSVAKPLARYLDTLETSIARAV